MKTLILFGSAREIGATRDMVEYFKMHMIGEIEVINAYKQDVAPCIDCRYCWSVRACALKDDMQDIYHRIEKADNIVFATPVYFNSIPAPLKLIVDRLQVYWGGGKRGDKPVETIKKGALLTVGGAPSFKNQFKGVECVINSIFREVKVKDVGTVRLAHTDEDSLNDKPDVKEEIIKLARRLSESSD